MSAVLAFAVLLLFFLLVCAFVTTMYYACIADCECTKRACNDYEYIP